jgi:glycerophosphoryl diester phosphodiesterase
MPHQHSLEIQGHRGAQGLKPENTLPSFEAAFDAGVSSVETDVRLSADGVPVLFHDDFLTERLCRSAPGSQAAMAFHEEPLVSSHTVAELRGVLVVCDSGRFPRQTDDITPLAEIFAAREGLAPYGIVTLADLFAFARAYAGRLGKKAGKTPAQQRRATQVRFDLEIKRVPYLPEVVGDAYTGLGPGLLETKLVDTVRRANLVARTTVRSFDHRAVRQVKLLEPGIDGAVLISGTTPVSPAAVTRLARAQIYAPDFQFVDPQVIREAHIKHVRVIPWTVNEAKDWEKLLAWGVDGITTDYPDQLATWLKETGDRRQESGGKS